jgi:hypothetical protein
VKTLIVYGNCQAEAVAYILKQGPKITERYKVLYLPSYDRPNAQELDPVARADISTCALIFEQHDRLMFPDRALLPADCVTVTFPSVDFSMLWPFWCRNPYDAPEPPQFWFGRFPYGDRIIVECIKRGMTSEDIIDYYLSAACWEQNKPSLDRLASLEFARLDTRDAHCHVKMREYVAGRYQSERIFWTINHPTGGVLRDLTEMLLRALNGRLPEIAGADVDHLMENVTPGGPLGSLSVPIHPRVAEHYKLSWYDAADRFPWPLYVNSYTYEEYFRALIRHSLDLAAANSQAPS